MKNDAQKAKPSLDQPMFGLIPIKDSNSQTAFQGHMIAASGEFVGTFLFLFFGFIGHLMAVDTAPNSGKNGVNSNQTVIYIAMSYGLSLLVTVWTLFRISGGLFNPAVTLAFLLRRELTATTAAAFIAVQLVGAVLGVWAAHLMFGEAVLQVSTKLRDGPAQALSEGVAPSASWRPF